MRNFNIRQWFPFFIKTAGKLSIPRDIKWSGVTAFISYRLRLVYRLSIEWRRESVVKEYQKILYPYTLLACSFTSGEYRREDAAMHFTLRLKIYCMPTSFSEFMACKVEAPKIYVAGPSCTTYGLFPSFLLNPKREFSKEEGTSPPRCWMHCVTRFAPDKSCFRDWHRVFRWSKRESC